MSKRASTGSTRVGQPADGRGTPRSRPSASCAEGRASSSTCPPAPRRSRATDAGRIYVETVLDRYLWLPGTPIRTSRSDRRLAASLYERGVPFDIVQAALLLGVTRRTFRSNDAPPLPPIRTLHYFLPLVDELLEQPLASGYAEYLERKLLPLADAKTEAARTVKVGGYRDPSS